MNTIPKGHPAYRLITDDVHDEVLVDVDDHGCKQVFFVYKVDDWADDYPEMADVGRGFYMLDAYVHPYDGILSDAGVLQPCEQREITTTEWCAL